MTGSRPCRRTGKRIVFESNRIGITEPNLPPTDRCATCSNQHVFDLFVMNPDGSEQVHLTRGSSATWSPDSKNIAFHASASGTGADQGRPGRGDLRQRHLRPERGRLPQAQGAPRSRSPARATAARSPRRTAPARRPGEASRLYQVAGRGFEEHHEQRGVYRRGPGLVDPTARRSRSPATIPIATPST